MDPALLAIISRNGVFLRHEAKDLGYSDRAVTRLVDAGVLHRVRHGTYTFTELWNAADEAGQHLIRSRSAFRTSDTEVALSHTSALVMHDVPFWGLDLRQVHLTRLDARSGRRAAGVSQHRGQILAGDLEYADDLIWTSAVRTALDLISVTDVERALIVVNGLLHAKKMTKAALENRSVEMLTWPHTARCELVLRYCNPWIESVGETRSWMAFRRAGLPEPEPQYVVIDGSGRFLGRVDFAWPELGVFVEFDGRVKYERLRRPGESATDVVLREKRREERICEEKDWICVRITWADLANPEALVERIRRAFRRAAGRRTAS